MERLDISYDAKKDFDNYIYSIIQNKIPKYGRENINISQHLWPSFINKLNSIPESKEKNKFIKDYIQNTYINSDFVDVSIKSLKKYWGNIEKEFTNELCLFMNTKSTDLNLKCYFTSLDICPYNIDEGYFYVPLFADLATQTKCIMHEIMHFVFLKNYKKYLIKRGLSESSISDINESLTILLNWKFKKFIMLPEQNNKPSIFDLQPIISKSYRDGFDFSEILEKLIETRLYKNNKAN